MLELMPFALHATSADPTHAELALSLACAFAPVDPVAVDQAVEGLAAALPAPHRSEPLEELAALSALVRRGPWPCAGHVPGPGGLLRPECGTIVDARELRPPLTWRCSHETCGLLIDALEPLWLRDGRLAHALTAAELRVCLPFEERARAHARRRLDQVRARLN